MKLFLSTLCATCLITSVSFASECEKGKCQKDKDKQEGTVLTDCGKCKKDDGCDKKKEDGCKDCDKCDSCDKKDCPSLADCGKCKKDDGCDKKKDDGCDKKKEGTVLA
jgi:hypothetical protein